MTKNESLMSEWMLASLRPIEALFPRLQRSNRSHRHVLDETDGRAPDDVVLIDVDLVKAVKEGSDDRVLDDTKWGCDQLHPT